MVAARTCLANPLAKKGMAHEPRPAREETLLPYFVPPERLSCVRLCLHSPEDDLKDALVARQAPRSYSGPDVQHPFHLAAHLVVLPNSAPLTLTKVQRGNTKLKTENVQHLWTLLQDHIPVCLCLLTLLHDLALQIGGSLTPPVRQSLLQFYSLGWLQRRPQHSYSNPECQDLPSRS